MVWSKTKLNRGMDLCLGIGFSEASYELDALLPTVLDQCRDALLPAILDKAFRGEL